MNNKKPLIICRLLVAFVILLTAVCTVPVHAKDNDQHSRILLEGAGTKEDPYLIDTYEDLTHFRDSVNHGTAYTDSYVYQTSNIDMRDLPWKPIGSDKHPFRGVYDGGGHYVENLNIPYGYAEDGRSGFFAFLGGTVANFGIKSGEVNGDYSGSIASKAVGTQAAILNCFSKATVVGAYAGGIAENFHGNGNVIACSWFDGILQGYERSGLLSSGGEVKLYHTYTTESVVAAVGDVFSPTSASVSKDLLYSQGFLRKLNLSTGLSQYLFGTKRNVDLMQWELNGESDIIFSQDHQYLDFFGAINLYLLPVLVAIIIVGYGIAFAVVGKNQIWGRFHGDIKAIAVISGVVSVFIDMAFIGKGLSYLNWGNLAFTVLVNFLFIVCVLIIVRNATFRFQMRRDLVPISIAILVVVVLEVLQFDIVPKFDGGIYYGSLVKAVDCSSWTSFHTLVHLCAGNGHTAWFC